MTTQPVVTITDELLAELEDEFRNHGSMASFNSDQVAEVVAELKHSRAHIAKLKRGLADADAAHMMYAEQVVQLNQQLVAAGITAENCELFRQAMDRTNVEAAAMKLAKCMDYPWQHMPEQGRNEMRKHAQAVIDAAMQEQSK